MAQAMTEDCLTPANPRHKRLRSPARAFRLRFNRTMFFFKFRNSLTDVDENLAICRTPFIFADVMELPKCFRINSQ